MRALGAALKPRGARRFFLAHAQSSIGSGIALVGLPLLAYERFHTPWALTVVLLCELLPAVLLGPLLGALADRLPRRTCLVAADVLRLGAFAALAFVPSLGLMIACAFVAGIGAALFNPAALASLSQVSSADYRPAAMSLYAALDDVGLTLGPAIAGGLLLAFDPQTLMAINACTFTISAALLATIPLTRRIARPSASLLASLRSGAREIAARPGVRLLLASSTGVVFAVGMVNVGEVMLARELLGVGGSGLAALMTASGVGTFLGSTFGARTGTSWQWRKAYMLGLVCMAADLILCAIAPFFWLILITFALGGFGNGLALVHDRLLLAHSVPEALHGRLFALHKTCTSGAFVLAFVAAGALISTLGVQAMFLCAGLLLVVIILIVRPHLRALWPEPVVDEPSASPLPLPSPGIT
jgi:MFS family permease